MPRRGSWLIYWQECSQQRTLPLVVGQRKLARMDFDHQRYEETLKRAHSCAWEGRWKEALALYRQAASMNPEAPEPFIGIGTACSELGLWGEAIEAYRKALNLEPDSPAFWEKLGDALLKTGQRMEAAQAYNSAGNLYRKRREYKKAIEAFLKAARAAPQLLEPATNLANLYLELGKKDLAVKTYLGLASYFKKKGDTAQASAFCKKALEIDPGNPQALVIKSSLELPAYTVPVEGSAPLESTRVSSVKSLANLLFETSLSEAGSHLAKALDAQSKGEIDEAIHYYKLAIEAGLDNPDIRFNLGLLYKEKLSLDEAITHLRKALEHEQLSLGAHFALGECFRLKGQLEEALRHFFEALRILDLSTLDHSRADEVTKIYKALAESFVAQGDKGKALEYINSLLSFFSLRGWEDKVREIKEYIKSMEEEGIVPSLAEIVETPSPEATLQSLAISQELIKKGLFRSAAEECMRGLVIAPFCLPLHIQLAEILIHQNKVEEAIQKYLLIAQLYELRGVPQRVLEVFQRLVRLNPIDINLRAKLINAFIRYGKLEEALDHYLQLAEILYEMADFKGAIESYRHALSLTARLPERKEHQSLILSRLFQLYLQTMHWKEAIKVGERLQELQPDNLEVRRSLLNLYSKLGMKAEEAREVGEIIALLREREGLQKTEAFLIDMIKENPRDPVLRRALANFYVELGLKEKAVEQLDILGEIQLDSGLIEEAKKTIREIIALGPSEAEAYRELLERLGG